MASGLGSKTNFKLHWKPFLCGGLKRKSHAAVVVNGTIYSFGGNFDTYSPTDPMDIHVLNASESPLEWKLLPPKTNDFAPSQRTRHTVVASGHLIYLWGGSFCNVQLRMFNIETLEWEKCEVKGKVPANRHNHSASVVRNKMYVFGGWDESTQSYSNSMKCLDLSTLSWSSISPKNHPPTPRIGHSSTVYGDRFILIFGGIEEGKGNCNSLVYFDVEMNEWFFPKVTGTIPEPREKHCAFILNGFMCIFSGNGNNGCLSDLFLYEFEKLQWVKLTPKGPNPDPRSNSQSIVVKDQVFIFGGAKDNSASDICDDTYILTIETRTTKIRFRVLSLSLLDYLRILR